MVEEFRVTLTLVLAVHITLLLYLALTSTSGGCKEPTIGYVELKNDVSVSGEAQLSHDPFSKTKSVCVGVLGSSAMDEFSSSRLSDLLDESMDANLKAGIENMKDSLNTMFLADPDENQKWTCDAPSGTCRMSVIGSTQSECEATCIVENPIVQIQNYKGGFQMCGDFFQDTMIYLSKNCKQGGGGVCDLTRIVENLPDMCDRLNLAGILLAASFAVSYFCMGLMIYNSNSEGSSRNTMILLLLGYICTLGISSASFTLYNLEMYQDGVDKYFWEPMLKRLRDGFRGPVNGAIGTLDEATMVMGSSYYYLLASCFLNLVVVLFIVISMCSKDGTKLLANINSRVHRGVERAGRKLFF